MADIELVIKIPEAEYDLIVNDEACGLNVLTRAIANGTPLPKGHGDLINRNDILCNDLQCSECGHTHECFRLLAPTIIEADKEPEDDNT